VIPGQDIAVRALELQAEGKKAVEIGVILGISRRQVFRLLGEAKERVSREEFRRWTVLDSLDREDPPEKIKDLLQTDEEREWTRGEASYAWQLHRLKPEMSPRLVAAFAEMYSNVAGSGDRDVRAKVLDMALLHEPWRDDATQARYFVSLELSSDDDVRFAVEVVWYLQWQNAFDAEPQPRQLNRQLVRRLESELRRRWAGFESRRARERQTGNVHLVPGPGKKH
jgi:hypothetical protein